jgi:hypothetical protein
MMGILWSESRDKIVEAIAKAQGAFKASEKGSTVTVTTSKGQYKFKYASLDDIAPTIQKPLSDNGLSLSHGPSVFGDETGAVFVDVTTTVSHASGQWCSTSVMLKAVPDNNGHVGPQAVGSLMTYGRRYGLCMLLAIVSDEDDDANIASGHTFTAGEKKKAQAEIAAENAKPANKQVAPAKIEHSQSILAAAVRAISNLADDAGYQEFLLKLAVREQAGEISTKDANILREESKTKMEILKAAEVSK